jgi:hypothetical protein
MTFSFDKNLYYNNIGVKTNMAHFAEINSYGNIVLRVVVIDNNDVNASGGDQSVGAEEKVKSIVPFTSGNRWVQTSYNNNFRKQYAGIGYTFDSVKNKFISHTTFCILVT